MDIIHEAFKQFEALNEDTFEATDKGIAELKDFEDNIDDDIYAQLDIIDKEAESENQIKDSYIGDVILDCIICHSKMYKDKEDVVIDEDGELANVEEECPVCGNTDGFKIIGEVAKFDMKDNGDEEEIKVNDDIEEIKESIRRRQNKRLNESKRYKSIKDIHRNINKSKKDLDELLDANLDLSNFGGQGNNVNVLSSIPGMPMNSDLDTSKKITERKKFKSLDDIDADMDDKKERAKARFARAKDDARADRDYRIKKDLGEGLKEKKLSDVLSPEAYKNWKKAMSNDAPVITWVREHGHGNDWSGFIDDMEYFFTDGLEDLPKEWFEESCKSKSRSKKLKESDKPAATSIEDAQKWVDFDMKKYGKISKRTNDLVKKAGFQIIKDDHGDYEVAAGKFESMKESKKLSEAPIYDLAPQYDARKSFHSKAKVDTGDKGDKNKLYSYNTLVAEIKNGKPVVYDTYSATTLRHIKEWLKQLGYKAESSKQIMADYGVKDESKKLKEEADDEAYRVADKIEAVIRERGSIEYDEFLDLLDRYTKKPKNKKDSDFEVDVASILNYSGINQDQKDGRFFIDESLKEDFNKVDIETDTQRMSMRSEDGGKVVVETEPIDTFEEDDEIIAPVSDETKDEIEMNSEGDEEIDDFDEEDVEVDDFVEESFSSLVKSYLTDLYENVKDYKTTNLKQTKDDKIIIEGLIRFNSGKAKPSKFVFESKEMTKRGKVKFVGENLSMTNKKNAFTLIGTLNKGKLLSESLNYNYSIKDNEGTHKIYGTKRNK